MQPRIVSRIRAYIFTFYVLIIFHYKQLQGDNYGGNVEKGASEDFFLKWLHCAIIGQEKMTYSESPLSVDITQYINIPEIFWEMKVEVGVGGYTAYLF